MIRNKKEIEEKLIERLTQKAKEYVKNMDEKSNGEYYPIDVIEKDLVDIQKVSQEIFKETTEELINAIDEDKEIEKKRETDEKLAKHKIRKINIATLGGILEINRVILYNRQMKKTVIPKDEYLKIANLPLKITKEMMVEFAFYAQNQISFEETKYMLEKTYEINTNAETIRKVAEYVGKQVFEEDTKEAEEKYENMHKLPMLTEKEKENETLYILTDGSTWIRNACKEIFPDAVQILDKFHLEENLYTFAKNKYGEDKSKYTKWVKTIMTYIESRKKR